MVPKKNVLLPDALAVTLLEAAHVCAAVRAGAALPDALANRPAQAQAPASTRAAVRDLCYRTMRDRGRADALLAAFATAMPKQPIVRELLVVAFTLLDRVAPDGTRATPPYAEFTVVDQAVAAVAASDATGSSKGFVNAVLRSYLRESARADQAAPPAQAVTMNYPSWWVKRLQMAYPEDWSDILLSGQAQPPLTLRVNRRRVSVSSYLARLHAAGVDGEQIGAYAVRLKRPTNVAAIPGFLEGLVSVQDEAAQRAAELLALEDGQRVLDACAAPGGKTCHILECADVTVTALDVQAKRLARVAQNLARLGLSAQLAEGDAAQPGQWWDGEPFARVLADLPCSASGIVRRHPDIRWLRRDADIAALSRQQQQILDGLWRVLAPDGKLLLVTCSIFPEEGLYLARDFAMRHADAVARPSGGQLLPAAGPTTDHDGLFFALFDKKA